MIKIDLHTHSTFSDGTLSPASLVKKARMKGITVLSLTDHDTIDGMGEFMKACRSCGIKCLTGGIEDLPGTKGQQQGKNSSSV
jgi:hypothetical protein